MKVLGVSGSPIPNSNTDRVLEAVLDMMEEGMTFVGAVKVLGNVPCVRAVRAKGPGAARAGAVPVAAQRRADAVGGSLVSIHSGQPR